MVGMVQLQTISIDEADGGVRPKQGNGEHFQEVATHLIGGFKLTLGFWFWSRMTFALPGLTQSGILPWLLAGLLVGGG